MHTFSIRGGFTPHRSMRGDQKMGVCGMSHGRRHGHGPKGQNFGPWAMFGGHWGQYPFSGPPWGGSGPWSRRPPKARRGDVRAAILAVIAESPSNGYQIIQEIAERSGGVWKPSPGSVYPTLQQLEDEGLVQADQGSGRRTFRLTETGLTYVDEHADEIAATWDSMSAAGDDGDDAGLKPVLGQVAGAMWQILATGTPEQQERAREALSRMRRELYGILAEDEPEDGERS